MKSRTFVFAILLTIAVVSPVRALTFSFSSYAEIHGFVYDTSGNRLADVQVSYIDNRNFFRAFTDSTGHFQLKLKMSDGMGFSKILSEEQKEICREYMNRGYMRSRLLFLPIFFGGNEKAAEKLGKNLYQREVSLSFKKLGMDSVEIHTVVDCRMADTELKLNSIGVIHMRPSDNYGFLRNSIQNLTSLIR